jgi:hypothetical protein
MAQSRQGRMKSKKSGTTIGNEKKLLRVLVKTEEGLSGKTVKNMASND